MSQSDSFDYSTALKDNTNNLLTNQLEADINQIKFDCERNKTQIFKLRKLSYKSIWSKDEDERLLQLVSLYGPKKWERIAEYFLNKTAIQCSARYRKINKNINKGKWTEEEKRNLMALIQVYGKNWGIIAKILKSRTSSQIRDKYLSSFDPNLFKKKFTLDEDLKIVKYYKIYGPDWNKINIFLKDRTPNVIKSRFYSKLRLKYRLGKSEKSIIKEDQGQRKHPTKMMQLLKQKEMESLLTNAPNLSSFRSELQISSFRERYEVESDALIKKLPLKEFNVSNETNFSIINSKPCSSCLNQNKLNSGFLEIYLIQDLWHFVNTQKFVFENIFLQMKKLINGVIIE